MEYLLTFSLATLSGFISDKLNNKNKWRIVFFALMILIPSILGGLRADTVGTDNLQTYEPMFTMIQRSGLSAFANLNIEYGTLLLAYVITLFTDNYQWFCFFTSLVTNIFMALGCYKFRDKAPFYLSFCGYLFLYYCQNINLIRQGIALSICFFALHYVIEHKWFKYCIFVVIAATFHISALLALILYPLYYLITTQKVSKWKVMIFFAVTLVYIGFPAILNWLLGIGILPTRFAQYIPPTSLVFNLQATIWRLPLLLVTIILVMGTKLKKDSFYKYQTYMLVVEMILIQYSGYFEPILRLGLYFQYGSVVIIPMSAYGVNKHSRKIAWILVILYYVLYWYYFTVLNNYHYNRPVFPFVFA